MKHAAAFYLLVISFFITTSCSMESCSIDFEENSEDYQQVIIEIGNLNLKMISDEPYSRIVKTIKKEDGIVNSLIFKDVEFIECHEDSTIIFQAPNCTKRSALKDDIFILVYAPKGESHILRKRNVRGLKRIDENWFQGYHVLSLAN